MPLFEPIIGMPDYKVIETIGTTPVEIRVEFLGRIACPKCEGDRLRKKDTFLRRIRHHCLGLKTSVILIKTHKFLCRGCGKYFNQRLPGVLPYGQSTELFKEEVATKHHLGHAKSKVAEFVRMSSSTVERYYQRHVHRQNQELKNAYCPKVLGIDEKHFTKKLGFMTTFADLKRRKVYDLALGRSEASLEGFLRKMPGKENCKVVVMDLCETFRNVVHKHFAKAMIVADRFHVIKLINHHFMHTWKMFDEVGRKHRGLMSLMRRHEWNLRDDDQRARLRNYLRSKTGLEIIYDFKQALTKLMLSRVFGKEQARPLVREFLEKIEQLKASGFAPLVTLGNTLECWQKEIVRMWRFKRTNSTTEGLHNRMEEILRRAYGMRNFENFKLRVKAFCG
jgi:transposase